MTAFHLLLDENTDPAFRPALHRQVPEIVVWAIGDPLAPPRGTPDPDILLWCERHGFALVTNNRASMPVHLADHLSGGRHVPAIFVIRPKATFGEVTAELALICSAGVLPSISTVSSTCRKPLHPASIR